MIAARRTLTEIVTVRCPQPPRETHENDITPSEAGATIRLSFPDDELCAPELMIPGVIVIWVSES